MGPQESQVPRERALSVKLFAMLLEILNNILVGFSNLLGDPGKGGAQLLSERPANCFPFEPVMIS